MRQTVKKRTGLLTVIALLLVSVCGTFTTAFAGTIEEECDLVFYKALEEILEEEGVTAPVVTVLKQPLYDLSLDQLGYLYLMRYGLKEGFALVVNTDGRFGISEFYMEGKNPYDGYDGQYLYIQQFVYFVYQDSTYIDTDSGLILGEAVIEGLQEKAFRSYANTIIYAKGTETLYYTNKTENTFKLTFRHPAYTWAVLANTCVPVAGGNLIGYWTRYYPELVPGFSPGSVQLGIYVYKEFATEADSLIEDMYYEMGTNVAGPGTSIPEFMAGMNSYVTGKGRSISYSNTVVNGAFNYALTKQRLEEGKPLALFISGYYRFDQFENISNGVILKYAESTFNHTMAGFGYHEVTYSLTSGATRTDTYIHVATGWDDRSKGYYNIYYNNTQIDACYAITVY